MKLKEVLTSYMQEDGLVGVIDENGESYRHLCIVKNNYLPESEKSMSYVLRFNEHLTFDITSERVKLNELALEDWIEDAKKMKEDGISYREISDKLLNKGYTVSKSKLQRKLN